jgi:hypothetical protein
MHHAHPPEQQHEDRHALHPTLSVWSTQRSLRLTPRPPSSTLGGVCCTPPTASPHVLRELDSVAVRACCPDPTNPHHRHHRAAAAAVKRALSMSWPHFARPPHSGLGPRPAGGNGTIFHGSPTNASLIACAHSPAVDEGRTLTRSSYKRRPGERRRRRGANDGLANIAASCNGGCPVVRTRARRQRWSDSAGGAALLSHVGSSMQRMCS